ASRLQQQQRPELEPAGMPALPREVRAAPGRGPGGRRPAAARGLRLAAALAAAALCLAGRGARAAWSLGPAAAGRRQVAGAAAAGLLTAVGTSGAALAASPPADWAPSAATLQTQRDKLVGLPGKLREEKWDDVRTTLKSLPVGLLWNLGDKKNTVRILGLEAGDDELMELSEEISSSLQLADQFTYDNAFVKFQPGNGKVRLDEPIEMIETAMKKLDKAIKLTSEAR
ncbi:unnamed protein product, partial [Prorocentrum cordatum]